MHDTYIKLDRSLLRHRYFDNVNVLKVWLWCLMKASHTPHKQLVGLQTAELNPGEFVTGRDAAARDLKMPGSTAWTILKLFEKDGKINIKSNNKFSTISIIDFHTYQVEKYQPRQQNRQQPDSNLTATGQHPDTNKKGKNEDNGKNKTYDTFSPSGDGGRAVGTDYYLTKKKRKLSGKRLITFDQFWEAFGYKKGRAEAADAWLDIPALTDSLVSKIIESAKEEATVRSAQVAAGHTPKMAQGWVSGRRWEDDVCALPVQTKKQGASSDDIEKALR